MVIAGPGEINDEYSAAYDFGKTTHHQEHVMYDMGKSVGSRDN
jgi:hypothetical protein